MEATLEKVIESELSKRCLLDEIDELIKTSKVSAYEIELTLNSSFNLKDARILNQYRQWEKF